MRALVLNSGGVDSTTCVAIAIEKYGVENVSTASIFYGQKHAKELAAAAKIAEYYGVKHYEMDLSKILDQSNCSLLKHSSEEIKHQSYAEQIAENGEGRVSTYVPFRNGLLLATAAALADSIYPEQRVNIFYGAHADDAAGRAYADCSPEFASAMSEAINIGTYGNIGIERPLINMNKAGVVAEGLRLKVPYELTWSCYEGGEKACGTCGTCIDRLAAFDSNGVKDPIAYSDGKEEIKEDTSKKVEKVFVSWDMVNIYIDNIAAWIKKNENPKMVGIFTFPKGGLVLATMLANKLDLPILMNPCNNCIIIDDIIDTGITMKKYSDLAEKNNYIITSMFIQAEQLDNDNSEADYKCNCDYFEKVKLHDWIVFPWEVE